MKGRLLDVSGVSFVFLGYLLLWHVMFNLLAINFNGYCLLSSICFSSWRLLLQVLGFEAIVQILARLKRIFIVCLG